MYTLRFLNSFKLTHISLIKGQQEKEKRTRKTLGILMQDPFYPSLKSHKVNTKSYGVRWSSWITGDLRLIWDFYKEEQKIIILFAVATHTGKHKEYK